jgi:DNA-directed RNA polymerase alpha subunit
MAELTSSFIAKQLERIADTLEYVEDYLTRQSTPVGSDSDYVDKLMCESMFKPILETQIEHMKLSTRTHNCLQAQGIRTIGELIQKEATAMLRYKNFGMKCLNELYYKLKLDYGIDKKSFLTKYNPPTDDIDSYLKFEKIKRRL